MTLALDGYDVLRRIGSSPETFSGLRGTIAEIAETLVKRQLTSKTLDLGGFRAIVIALGDDTVSLVLQTLTRDELHALAALLDPHHEAHGSRNTSWVEGHLLDLAHYRADPAPKSARGTKRKPKSKKTAVATKRKHADPLGTGSMGLERAHRGKSFDKEE